MWKLAAFSDTSQPPLAPTIFQATGGAAQSASRRPLRAGAVERHEGEAARFEQTAMDDAVEALLVAEQQQRPLTMGDGLRGRVAAAAVAVGNREDLVLRRGEAQPICPFEFRSPRHRRQRGGGGGFAATYRGEGDEAR